MSNISGNIYYIMYAAWINDYNWEAEISSAVEEFYSQPTLIVNFYMSVKYENFTEDCNVIQSRFLSKWKGKKSTFLDFLSSENSSTKVK